MKLSKNKDNETRKPESGNLRIRMKLRTGREAKKRTPQDLRQSIVYP